MDGTDSRTVTDSRLLYAQGDMDDFSSEIERMTSVKPGRVNANAENVEHDLSRLVLTLIELLRQLLERQALRRVESGNLSDDEIERLGNTFQRLQERMEELKLAFGLKDDELNLDLGPIGDLL